MIDKKLSDYTPAYKTISLLGRGIRRFWYLSHISGFEHYFSFYNQNIKKYDVIILCESMYFMDIIRYIRRGNPRCRVILWMWNSVESLTTTCLYDEHKIFLKAIDKTTQCKYRYEIWSFDKEDCNKYQLNYNNQFCVKMDIQCTSIQFDAVFIGEDKGRLRLLKKIENILLPKSRFSTRAAY